MNARSLRTRIAAKSSNRRNRVNEFRIARKFKTFNREFSTRSRHLPRHRQQHNPIMRTIFHSSLLAHGRGNCNAPIFPIGNLLTFVTMDIRNRKLLYLKGGLFVVGGLLASVGILLEAPKVQVALMLAVAIWCFARAYYFVFYVIEHYIDPSYRFAGLWSFVRYVMNRTEPSSPGSSPNNSEASE